MKIKSFYITVFVFALLFSACEKPTGTLTISDLDEHPVYFQFEYFNLAWGYQHRGFFIDGEGNIMGFEFPLTDSTKVWTNHYNTDLYTETELKDNFAHATEFLGEVDIEDLLPKVNRIPDIDLNDLSERVNQTIDGGTFGLYAYLWNSDEEKYLKILLESRGDSGQKNESSAARSIVNWLTNVGDDIYEDHWFGW